MLKNIHNVLSTKETHKAALCSPFWLKGQAQILLYSKTWYLCSRSSASRTGEKQTHFTTFHTCRVFTPLFCTFAVLFWFIFLAVNLTSQALEDGDGDEGVKHKKKNRVCYSQWWFRGPSWEQDPSRSAHRQSSCHPAAKPEIWTSKLEKAEEGESIILSWGAETSSSQWPSSCCHTGHRWHPWETDHTSWVPVQLFTTPSSPNKKELLGSTPNYLQMYFLFSWASINTIQPRTG